MLVLFLGWEDPLEKEMATPSSLLAWEIPWKEEAGRLLSMGPQRVRHTWAQMYSCIYSPTVNQIVSWCEELTHLKKPWCWERFKVGEGDDRGWNGWMASPIQWTWVWVNSRSWWWTGRPGLLQSMRSQSQTWLSNWTELNDSNLLDRY